MLPWTMNASSDESNCLSDVLRLRPFRAMTFLPRFSITNTVTAAITQIERARGFLEAASLSDEWVSSMRSRAFLLEAHHTTHIEGTRLTVDDAAAILAGHSVPDADPEDTRELLNYRDAFEYVSAYLSDGGPVTERLILEIHRRLVGGVRGGSAAPGKYRLVQNYIVNSATGETIYTPPPASSRARDDARTRQLAESTDRHTSCDRQRHRPVPTCPYSPVSRRERTRVPAAFHAAALQGGLRFQAALLRLANTMTATGCPSTERFRESDSLQHGYDGLDRVFCRRPCHAAQRGQAEEVGRLSGRMFSVGCMLLRTGRRRRWATYWRTVE